MSDRLQQITQTFSIGSYIQAIKWLVASSGLDVQAIQDISCSCRYGSVYVDAWVKGEKVCRHIQLLLKRENEGQEER